MEREEGGEVFGGFGLARMAGACNAKDPGEKRKGAEREEFYFSCG